MSNQKNNVFPAIPLEQCLAKTRGNQPGCSVYTHLKTTCRILRLLRQLYKNTPREKLMIPEADYLAAWHDIGKMTPSFTAKIYNALGRDAPGGIVLNKMFYQDFDHAVAGGAIMEAKGNKIANIISNHHGTNARIPGLGTAETLGGANWTAMREELLKKLQKDLDLEDCGRLKIPADQQSTLLGMTILADWLSSGMDIEPGAEPSEEDLQRFLSERGFAPFKIKSGLSFQDIFGFKPNTLQETSAQHLTPGEIHTIECTMGAGKTECALFMAYKLLESNQANGIYFALPTQLTSEKIHERFDKFLTKIISGDNDKAVSSLLIHGESALAWNLKIATADDINTESNPDSWFQTKKRALLAPFAVGTIDQALLSILRVRHNALRAFALTGKVVIIDELHSYDNYTNKLIVNLIENLSSWECTVILLSATLTTQSRRNFAQIKPSATLSEAY
ncbi:MAG: HD domain-containing protein, partial [Victivallaceae bacterium]